MTHTFGEILSRTPADPNEAPPDAAMPPRALRTLLRDAAEGLRPLPNPRNPPPMAPNSPSPGMGHQRPTDLATSPPPGHRKGKGQREGPRQEGRERHKVRGMHLREKGTASNTTWGQGITGGPPTMGAGQGGGHTNTEGGGREEGRRRDRHPPSPPHPVDTARPPGDTGTGTRTPGHPTDHPRGTRPPRCAIAAQN